MAPRDHAEVLDVTVAALHRLIPHEISPMAVLTYKCSHLQVEKLTHKSQEESGLLGACDEWGFAVGSPDVGCGTSSWNKTNLQIL